MPRCPYWQTTIEQNKEIIDLYFNRKPGQVMDITLGAGIGEMHEEETDIVAKEIVKNLSMQYECVRQKITLENGNEHINLNFETHPGMGVDQFITTRQILDKYHTEISQVLKSLGDLLEFVDYLESAQSLPAVAATYMAKINGAMKRLRRELIVACNFGKDGVHCLK